MRIALVTTTFLPKIGGAQLTVHHLAQQWCRDGHEVFVINAVADRVSDPNACYRLLMYPEVRGAFRFGYHRFPFAWYYTRRLRRLLEMVQPEFISAHFGYPTALWLVRLRPVPRFVITCHGEELHHSSEFSRQRYAIDDVLAETLNQSSAVIAISSYARRTLEQIGVKSSKIRDIPNGADRERFARPIEDFNLRHRFRIPEQSTVTLSVGRDNSAKAYDVALRAFALATQDRENAYYLILGRDTARWTVLANELGVQAKVIFCDGLYGDELVGTYQQADVFLMSSKLEACPLVVPEAMAAGLPAVVTDVGGCQDMVADGISGLVSDVGDIDALSKNLRQLLSDPTTRKRMGDAARTRSAHYDWRAISRRYLELG